MNISILCTDPNHPVVPRLRQWQAERAAQGHAVALVHDKAQLQGGDILFLVSCSQLLRPEERARYRATLVLHASDLPQGRGWSPHIWAVLRGEREITVCLLEAQDPVDSGAVWLRKKFRLDGSELLAEINELLFRAELDLMSEAVEGFGRIVPQAQNGDPGPYLPRRTPADSRVDPNKTIAEQFELLRVVDPERYPAFFDHRGHRYVIRIEKVSDHVQK